ncbi:MAG: ribonuclease P protein component [Actinomycetota bacterium]|nr:ribonuclease P protein component [Actinomycetota bacterium]
MAKAGRVGHVRDRATFVALRRSGRRAHVGTLTLTWLPGVAGDPAPPRVAYAIGRTIGPAVQRNLVRRRLRAVVAELVPDMSSGDYLVALGKPAETPEIGEVRRMMAEALEALQETGAAASAGGRRRVGRS